MARVAVRHFGATRGALDTAGAAAEPPTDLLRIRRFPPHQVRSLACRLAWQALAVSDEKP